MAFTRRFRRRRKPPKERTFGLAAVSPPFNNTYAPNSLTRCTWPSRRACWDLARIFLAASMRPRLATGASSMFRAPGLPTSSSTNDTSNGDDRYQTYRPRDRRDAGFRAPATSPDDPIERDRFNVDHSIREFSHFGREGRHPRRCDDGTTARYPAARRSEMVQDGAHRLPGLFASAVAA